MNRYPLWKYLLLLVVLGLGITYALPNIYAPDPAVQVSGYSADLKVDERALKQIEKALTDANIPYKSAVLEESGSALVRLTAIDDQLKAQRAIEDRFGLIKRKNEGDQYIVALNSAQTTPQWLRDLGASPMNLGLDLAGGVHFVLEVDTPKAVNDRLLDSEDVVKKAVRKARIFDVKVSIEKGVLTVQTPTEEAQLQLSNILRDELPRMQRKSTTENGKFIIRAKLTEDAIREIEDHAVSQNLTTLRNRVNELGVAEPLVQRLGRNRIIVELPGVQDTARAKKVIGKTANLEFRLEAKPDAGFAQREKFTHRQEDMQIMTGGGSYLERRPIITGESVTNATRGFDPETSQPQVNISLDADGGAAMHRATRNNVGRRLGVLFIEYRPSTRKVKEADGTIRTVVDTIPIKNIISLATIQSALGREFRTTGLSEAEAGELALLLRAGALAAPMVFVEERTIGPSLGKENIELGVKSIKLGMILVVIIMLLYYRVFGIAANIALAFNVALIAAIMSPFATLTLPGLAGIVLTVGMAVDANVLIFSRIKEELKAGMPPQSAISAGFDRAFTTILDANITTLIVALILFGIGSGPIKGFAVTLSIGILTSMFTAIVVTRAVVNLIYGGRQVKKLSI